MAASLSSQLNHRSVRRFAAQPLAPALIAQLVAVAQHTATSHFLQSFSLIEIKDAALRTKIAAISHQAYVDGNGSLFIFVLDQYRAAAAAGDPRALGSADKFLQSASDAVLACQNMVNAAESLGLGTVVLGSVLNDPNALIDLLHLPRHTFPVLGLMVGVPAQDTQPKPRMPEAMMHFVDGYDEQAATAGFADYDAVVRAYYAHRRTNARAESFTHLLQAGAGQTPAKRGELLAALHRQGFLLD